MIDFHSHILPQIDDGAKTPETSEKMLQMEISQGVKTVVLTPHYYGKHSSPKRFLEKREKAFERLNAYLPMGIEVKKGAEVHFTGVNMPDFEELATLAIEGTKYILLEFPFTTVWHSGLFEKLDDFIYETGCTPIIAHVERYREVQKKPALLKRLTDMGCLLQVNCYRFSNRFAVRHCATETMHPCRHQNFRCIGVNVKTFCNQSILRNFCHSAPPRRGCRRGIPI